MCRLVRIESSLLDDTRRPPVRVAICALVMMVVAPWSIATNAQDSFSSSTSGGSIRRWVAPPTIPSEDWALLPDVSEESTQAVHEARVAYQHASPMPPPTTQPPASYVVVPEQSWGDMEYAVPDETGIITDPSSAGPPARRAEGFGDGTERAPFRAQAFWIPSRDLKNVPGTLTMQGEELAIAFPILIEEGGITLATAGIDRREISTSAAFPNSGLAVPDQLWDIEFGVMRFRSWDNGWRSGAMVRVGSPSDKPFDELRDMTLTLLGFVSIPANERDAWNLSLFYSPTGQIIYPIPGVAYQWRPSDRFQANIGVPFSIEYRPTDMLTISASYRPLNNVQVVARRALGDRWHLYGSYRTVNDTYLLSERDDSQQRTYFFDQRLTLGVQRALGPNWTLDFSTSYIFDRRIFQARKFSGPRTDELDIESGVGAMLQLSWNR